MTDAQINAIDEAIRAGWKPRGWMRIHWSYERAAAAKRLAMDCPEVAQPMDCPEVAQPRGPGRL